MTSFTRKLYNKDPAAEHFQRSQQFETRIRYGKHSTLAQFVIGRRVAKRLKACAASCGRAECRMGCTLSGQFD